MESETHKILGRLGKKTVEPAEFALSAACHRVAVLDGHLTAVSVKFHRRPTRKALLAAIAAFRPLSKLSLPSAPDQPLLYREEDDRPQPRLDADRDGGMGITMGRLRPCSVLDWKFDALGHNVVRGAAGAAILNAEILEREGRL